MANMVRQLERQIEGIEECLARIELSLDKEQCKFSSFSILLRIDNSAAPSYTNCYFKNPTIASVGGNYNHYNFQSDNGNHKPYSLLIILLPFLIHFTPLWLLNLQLSRQIDSCGNILL